MPEVWISEDLISRLLIEAEDKYPFETGGVLMGYWINGGDGAVISHVIGPGPNAKHNRYSFYPDSSYQAKSISNHYAKSERRLTYLGDWHTHPVSENLGVCSHEDMKTLTRIAKSPRARVEKPIMLILAGTPDEWKLRIWRGYVEKNRIFGRKITVNEMTVRNYT